MSVALGISPRELLALDGETFEALQEEASTARRWSSELELLATLTEIAHAHLLAFWGVHAKKSTRLPKQLEVPRPKPERDAATRPAPMRLSSFAKIASESAELVEADRAG